MSGYKKRERRQVSFNTEDAVERELLEFVDRKDINFSGLVKNLLFAYRMGHLAARPEPGMTPGSLPAGGLTDRSRPTAAYQQIKASGMPFDF
ncbi:hypothetical protein [Staphylospora marina]|uniref:hypothetical protein n=1 Tax=Staphylospora marina TaxID=2490858 RepID=UPI000F5B9E5A|nr:hypothetical protein [Staphylospora marina]